MTTTIAVEGHEVSVDIQGSSISLRTDALKDPYHNLDTLTDALRRYNLSLRKSFTNPDAFLFAGWGTKIVEPVVVTSITEDGKEAWVRRRDTRNGKEGKRSKVRLADLYAEREGLDAIQTREQEHKQEIATMWENVKRWEPNSQKG